MKLMRICLLLFILLFLVAASEDPTNLYLDNDEIEQLAKDIADSSSFELVTIPSHRTHARKMKELSI